MISVSIVGILAITAVPSFNKYLYKAKSVEAFNSIDVIRKAQVQHYLNYGRFVSADLNRSLTSSKGKQLLQAGAGSVEDWDKLGWPLPADSRNYFGFFVNGGFTNAAGNPFRSYWDANDPATLDSSVFNWDGANVTTFFSLSPVTQCFFNWNDADLGINQNPGEDWVVIIAGANFEEEPDHTCTQYIQVTNRSDGTLTSTPIIALNEGQ